MNKIIRAWLELTKPRITLMQLVSVSIGYFCHSNFKSVNHNFIFLVFGTLCASAAAAMLNHLLEKNEDAIMQRTQNRPLVLGIVDTRWVKIVSLLLISSAYYFMSKINMLTTLLTLMTIFLYVAVYTPLKKVTWLNTFVGALPGILPILGGWYAFELRFSLEVVFLMLIMFLWQFPHFFVLSYLYSSDYKKAGFKMLSGEIGADFKVKRQTIVYLFLMIVSCYFLLFVQNYGYIYLLAITIYSVILVKAVYSFVKYYNIKNAKRFFLLTVVFLPFWFLVLLVEHFI